MSEKIEEQVKAGSFPVRLRGDEWNSGEIVWLLDLIAPNRQLATSVLVSFGQLAREAPVRIHPLVGRNVDPEVLAKLRGNAATGAEPQETRQ
ncbi:MAG: hypothetical protein JJ864_02905 [Rhizobiaceae bacterium]|nr:hypothetical protein [Rhizobiaceae bacterium]